MVYLYLVCMRAVTSHDITPDTQATDFGGIEGLKASYGYDWSMANGDYCIRVS